MKSNLKVSPPWAFWESNSREVTAGLFFALMPMNNIDDGDTAFPNAKQSWGTYEATGGMSLRDYFAAKAMQGLIPSLGEEQIHPTQSGMLADHAYTIADAMIARRKPQA